MYFFTNNIIPSSQIISKASERGIPLLVVPQDTYSIAKQVDNIEGLLIKEDTERIDLLSRLIKENVEIEQIIE